MNDEFDRLMKTPRLCRCCGKPCGGLRCRKCYSVVGRIVRLLTQSDPKGMTEQRLSQMLMVDRALCNAEKNGHLHETQKGWMRGRHPEQVALQQAWQKRGYP